MRVRKMRTVTGILTALIVLSCGKRAFVPAGAAFRPNRGNCAGCLLIADERLFSLVVRTDADYDSLTADCYPDRIREEWLPPRPGAGEELIYVSLKGGGCKGCLDIVEVRETSLNIVVEVAGGFQGGCDMLIVPGAWVLIPGTGKSVIFRFREISCPDDL